MIPLLALFITTATVPPQADYIVQVQHDDVSCHGTPIGVVHLLTAAHCAGADIINWHGQGLQGKARLMWKDEKRDIAMYQASPIPGWAVVKIAGKPAGPTEQVYFRSYLPQRVSVVATGFYLGVDDEGDIDIWGYLAPGGSGSGLLNSRGELIGVLKQVFNAFSVKHAAITPEDQLRILSVAAKFSPAGAAAPITKWPEK